MGLLKDLLYVAGAAVGVKLIDKAIKDKKESDIAREERQKEKRIEEERKSTPFSFRNETEKNEFRKIVERKCREFKRIKLVEIDNQYVVCEVISASGASSWEFILDFNDFGKLTGKYYWHTYGNYDATIQQTFADNLASELDELLNKNYFGTSETNQVIICGFRKATHILYLNENDQWFFEEKDILNVDNVTWEEILSVLKPIVENRKSIKEECESRLSEAHKHKNCLEDQVFILYETKSDSYLEFAAYQGFLYQLNKGCFFIHKKSKNDELSDEDIINNFWHFYHRGTVVSRDDWK